MAWVSAQPRLRLPGRAFTCGAPMNSLNVQNCLAACRLSISSLRSDEVLLLGTDQGCLRPARRRGVMLALTHQLWGIMDLAC